MNNYKLKRHYAPTPRVVALFRGAFALVLIGFVLELMALISLPEGSYSLQGNRAILLFAAAFAVALILLVANATLWFGMLHFLAVYDGRRLFKRLLWAVITFFGVSGGAALYYWFVYRRYVVSMPDNR